MNKKSVANLLRVISTVVDVAAPVIAVLIQFPLWIKESSGATVSGIAVLLIIISAIPLRNRIKSFMQSPSIPVLWAVFFGLFVLLSNIIKQMIVVAFVGLVSNIIGTIINLIAKVVEKR